MDGELLPTDRMSNTAAVHIDKAAVNLTTYAIVKLWGLSLPSARKFTLMQMPAELLAAAMLDLEGGNNKRLAIPHRTRVR